jgi:hypothetical protein
VISPVFEAELFSNEGYRNDGFEVENNPSKGGPACQAGCLKINKELFQSRKQTPSLKTAVFNLVILTDTSKLRCYTLAYAPAHVLVFSVVCANMRYEPSHVSQDCHMASLSIDLLHMAMKLRLCGWIVRVLAE